MRQLRTGMQRLPLSCTTITNVTTLIQSQRDALSLVQAALTGLEAPSLKVQGGYNGMVARQLTPSPTLR